MSHSAPHVLRLLDDPPLAGAANMARDEALMTRAGEGESPPSLRLYGWQPPTISLGYFQPYADYQALAPPAGELDVVRRPTGGGAILHDLELTYSIVVPAHHPLLGEGANHLYELAHDAVIAALDAMETPAHRGGETDDSSPTRGPFFCFARRHKFDVLVGADKLAGSAQRRTRQAVLQHGSIIVGNRYAQQPTAVTALDPQAAVAELRKLFPAALAKLADLDLQRGEWTAPELNDAVALEPKHRGDVWLKRK